MTPTTHRPIVWALSLGLSALPTVGWAQAGQGDARENITLSVDQLDQAETTFFKGLAAYRAGRFDEAIADFQKAYALSKHRDMLFNLGRSYEGKGDKANAVTAYRRYLATDPVDESAIIQRIKQLGGDPTPLIPKGEDPKAAPGLDPTQEAPEIATQGTNPWPWVLVGVGAVGVGVGTVLGVQALDDADAARSESSRSAAESLKDDAESGALLADVSVGLGLVALGAGVVWLLLDEEEDDGTPRVEVQASGTHFGLGVNGTF